MEATIQNCEASKDGGGIAVIGESSVLRLEGEVVLEKNKAKTEVVELSSWRRAVKLRISGATGRLSSSQRQKQSGLIAVLLRRFSTRR